ncbi:transposase [Clostridium puniceum]|uniref:Transposase n=2 Tax=Clostridium puniceum TaxID=29367 RepID=A0A1S8TRU5_9CLOT|nr:transposase [Clostridium puniceum]
MIDIDTHRVIDMIFSREINDVTKWLKTYPNMQIVSRDGSITYNNAISLAHPKAIQISDRFHLLKNLTTYCKDYLTKFFKPQIVIDKNVDTSNKPQFCVNENKNISQHERALKALTMINSGHTKTEVCKTLNMDIRTLNKILKLNGNDINYYCKNKLTLIQEERLKIKQELINKVRKMKNNYCSVSEIAKNLNLDRRTVTKYLNPHTTGISGNSGMKRKSILDTYISYIDGMIDLGATSTQILEKIRKQGYIGSSSTIRNYMSQRKNLLTYNHKNNSYNKTDHMLIERKSLIKLLFNPIDKIKGLTPMILNKVYEKFPVYKEIIDIVSDFRTLLKNKISEKLDNWLNRASNLNIGEINSFINGIKRDINAVKNAIIYDYNNGLAEGSVNKLKVIKRIMYGRCSFALLRSKILNLEYLKFN